MLICEIRKKPQIKLNEIVGLQTKLLIICMHVL